MQSRNFQRYSNIQIFNPQFTCPYTLEFSCRNHLPIYSLEQSLPFEANRYSASQEIPRILWKPKVHYRIHKCPPPVPILSRSIQSIPQHPTSWRSILILSYHLRLGLQSGLFPSGFTTKTLYAPLLSPMHAACHAHHAHLILVMITRTILFEQYRSLNSSIYRFLHSAVSSSHLGQNILFNTLFSNTLSLRSSLNVSDQVSHPYNTCKIIVLYILIFKFLDIKLEDTIFCTKW